MSTYDPAFPSLVKEHMGDGHVREYLAGGLSRREYFAAKAMQGLLAKPIVFMDFYHTQNPDKIETAVARDAARYADALIIELSKERA